jgi:hypothetical protein
MQVIIENIVLCSDCTQAAVNDDYTGLDYHYGEVEGKERFQAITAGLRRLGSGLVWDSNQEPDEFSSRPCDCCGTRLAGGRDFFCILGD